MDKTMPAELSIFGLDTVPRGRTVRTSQRRRQRYLGQMAVRLSHEAPIPLKDVIDELEKKVIVRVLNEVDGNQKDAARILGMKYTTLNEKLKRYRIKVRRISIVE